MIVYVSHRSSLTSGGRIASPAMASDPASLAAWAATAEEVRATRSRLAKGAALRRYFVALDDDALVVAARFFAGTVFPRHDARTVQVGPALLFRTMAVVAGADPDRLGDRWVAHGDGGDLAAELFAGRPSAELRLVDVAARVAALPAAANTAARTAALTGLLEALGPQEARYLVRLLLGELRIGLKEPQVEEAIAAVSDVPLADVRRANLLRGDVGEVALLARRRALATARLTLFHPLGFMLAQPLATAAEVAEALPAPFVLEDKYDGIRAQAHVAGGRVVLFSRTLDDISGGYPDVLPSLAGLPDGLVLDGELLAIDPADPSRARPFRVLQQRLGRKKPSAGLIADVPVTLVVFDVLAQDGGLVIDEPWQSRRARLDALPWPDAGGRLAPARMASDAAAVDAAFDEARAGGNEGIVAKDPSSAYAPGRRGGAWIKLKRALATLDVVVTAVERGHGRRRDVLSDYTFAVRASEDDPALLDVGKAFTGLTDREIAEMTTRFEGLTLERRGGWHRVEPVVVIEVTFDVVQPSQRHAAGFALRFPRIVRIRDDKPPSEIDTLARVRELAG
jgi:DNA ligase-1